MKRTLFILFIAALLLTACAPAAATPAPRSIVPSLSGGAAPNNAPADAAKAPPSAASAGDSTTTQAVAAQDRKVIENADLTIVVDDPQLKMAQIDAMAKRLGGFVVSSNMGQTYVSDNVKVPNGSITIRVPADSLDAALNEIKTNTVEIQVENRTGQDVTDQYTDLQSQLKAKQAAADKLYEIMQTTTKADDTLLVFNQLTQLQSEIEVLKGQIKYIDQAASLSAINVRLIAKETIQPIQIAGWQPQGVARNALQSLIYFFQGFVNFLIYLVLLYIPVAAVVIALLAFLWRLLRWFWRKVSPRKTPPPAAA